ncbi:MAG: TonB-dependent receptor [Gammaproteobacteria bacterium]|nr:TonB-dependent receptor [Gammaproteobacteria bacterium]
MRTICIRGLTIGAIAATMLPLAAAADEALEEVVVTAQRTSERLQDVPIAVTALSAADLADRGVRQAGDITSGVPNMLLNSPYGPEAQPTFTLRGVTTQDYSQNQSSPIAMYVDEVYKPVGAVQAQQTYDLDRVEVLRGPQGTLYGKNATGGAVSFYSRNPSLSQAEGYVIAGFGNYGMYSVNAAAGGPIVADEFGMRIALSYLKRDGWVHSIVPGVAPLNGVDALAGRLSFLYQASDTLTAALKVGMSHSGGTPYGAHALNVDPTYYSGSIGWFDNGAKYAVHKQIINDNVALRIEWLASEHTSLTSITGFDFGRWYTKSDDGGLPVTLRLDDPNTYFSTTNDFSEELRLASRDTGNLSWLAGLYFGRESTHATIEYHFFDSYDLGYFALPGGTPLLGFDEFNSFDQLKDSKAAFLNGTIKATAAVTLRAGARYTRDRVTIGNFYALEGGPLAPGPTGYSPDGGAVTYWTQTIGAADQLPSYAFYQTGTAPQGPLRNLSRDDNNFSFRAGADWKPADGVLAYVNISQGYRGAAFNGQAFNFYQEANFANPERLTSYELGLKADLWQHRGSFNAALFHYDYRNQQFLDSFTLPGGQGSGFRTVNAPKSRVDGAEFEFKARVTEDLEIDASLGLMNSKYVDLTLHAATRPDPANGLAACCTGNKLIQAPDYNGGLSLNWRFRRTAAGDLHAVLAGNLYGKQYFDAYNTERIAQGAYGVYNIRIALEPNGKRGFSADAWVKNLANEKYLAYGLNQNDPDTGAIGFDYALVGEPRTYGIDFGYRF